MFKIKVHKKPEVISWMRYQGYGDCNLQVGDAVQLEKYEGEFMVDSKIPTFGGEKVMFVKVSDEGLEYGYFLTPTLGYRVIDHKF